MIDAEMRTVRRDRWPSETPWMLGLAIRGAADVAVEARRRRRKDEQGVRSPPPGGISMSWTQPLPGCRPITGRARTAVPGVACRSRSCPCRGSREVEHWTAAVNAVTTNPILSPFDEAYARYRAGAALLASGGRDTRAAARGRFGAPWKSPGISAPRPSRKTCCGLRATRISAWATRANRRHAGTARP